MKNNVLVIGNGFDLHHGLKTKYQDFIEFVREWDYHKEDISSNIEEAKEFEQIIENNGFIKYFIDYNTILSGWIDLEREIEFIVETFDKFLNEMFEMEKKSGQLKRIYVDTSKYENKRRLACKNFKYIFTSQSNGYMLSLNSGLYDRSYGIKKDKILFYLKSQLDDLSRALFIYLESFIGLQYKNSDIEVSQQIQDVDPCYVINFNYTDTYRIYGINDDNVFYIHGSLLNRNIILGTKDNNEDSTFIYFKKYFQRIQKRTGYIDDSKFMQKSNMNTDKPLVYIYGHSLDETDSETLIEIIRKSKGVRIFYLNQEDYEAKVINLIKMYGKKEVITDMRSGFMDFIEIKKK